MVGPKEKIERALGERLGLKAHRCSSPKCAMTRRPYRPGVHGQKRKRGSLSEFGTQIKEKRKFKVSYGLDERNLRQIIEKAKPLSGATILQLLERRLDNTVYRFGFAPSRIMARQLVNHGHVLVNGKGVKSPGFQVKKGDVVGIRTESKKLASFKDIAEVWKHYDLPNWLKIDTEKLEGTVVSLPQNVESQFEVNLLVESFSK